MTPGRWHEVTEIFHAALSHDPETREAFIAAACRDDDDLRGDVARLLAAHDAAAALGDVPPVSVPADAAPLEPGRLLAWEQRATAANPDAGRREHHLEPLGPGRCAYHHTDTFLGVNAAKIMAEHGAWVKQGFDGMARDLKRRAEALWNERRRGSAAAASAS